MADRIMEAAMAAIGLAFAAVAVALAVRVVTFIILGA